MQFGQIQLGFKPSPDADGQVLRRGDLVFEIRNFLVKKAMVHCIDDLAIHDLLELFQVDHKSRPLVHISLYRNFQRVVVPVAMRIIALAKDAQILFRGNQTPCSVFNGRVYAYTAHADLGGDGCQDVGLNMSVLADTITFAGSNSFNLTYDLSIALPLLTMGLID